MTAALQQLRTLWQRLTGQLQLLAAKFAYEEGHRRAAQMAQDGASLGDIWIVVHDMPQGDMRDGFTDYLVNVGRQGAAS